MIIVTGGGGFIGSCLVWRLNELGHEDIIVVDDLGTNDKWRNLAKRRIENILGIDQFRHWLNGNSNRVSAIFHMGACSTTTEADADFLMRNNVHYSMDLFTYCADKRIPFIYASSAATYGDGQRGYDDRLTNLLPMNKYGFSKYFFDMWALRQAHTPPFWAGLKFFNVYGPQEYHKGGQASVVFHAFPQVLEKQRLRLFKSYRDGIAHGDQKRDFVYVKDAVDVMIHLYEQQDHVVPGIYNVGSGHARTFADLGRAVFSALDLPSPAFEWIDMPVELRDQYQYFTEADLDRLRNDGGYGKPMTTLEDGVRDYIVNYLTNADRYL